MQEEVLVPIFSMDLQTGRLYVSNDTGFFAGNVVYCMPRTLESSSPLISFYRHKLQKLINSSKMIGNITKLSEEKLYLMLVNIDEILKTDEVKDLSKWTIVYDALSEVYQNMHKK